MVTQVNQNLDNNYINGYAQQNRNQTRNQSTNSQNIIIPNYYYVQESYPQESVKDIFKESPVYSMFLKPFIEHPLAVLGTWIGMSWFMNKYNEACSGNYENSLLKKATDYGDKVQNSKLVQSSVIQKVLNIFKTAEKKGGNVVENNSVLRAMRDTPSMPELSFVKSQMFNLKQEVVQDFNKITETLKLSSDGFAHLKDLGLTGSEKEMLKQAFNVDSLSKVSEEKASNYLLLKRLGKSEKEIQKILSAGDRSSYLTKQQILKEMGLTSKEVVEIKNDMFGKYIDKVQKATKKAGNRVIIGGGHYNWMGILTKPFERTIGCDEIHNKLYSLSKENGSTATGRFMSRSMQTVHRCFTFGQGKLASLIFIAPLLVEAAVNASKADDDQKVGTIASGLIETTSWIVTWPLAVRLLHRLGGIQYAGMSKNQVEEYRKVLNSFNSRTKAQIEIDGVKVENKNMFKTKSEYDIAKQATKKKLAEISKVENQGFFAKFARKIGRFLTLDLETFKGCNSGNFLQNISSKMPNVFKNIVGVPLRIGIFALLAMGLLDGSISLICRKIFGKPYDAEKHDERKLERKTQKQYLFDDLNQRMLDIGKNKVQEYNKAQNINMKGKATLNKNSENVLNPEINIDNYSYVPSQKNIIPHETKKNIDNYSYIPSQNNIISDMDKTTHNRNYIPSQAAANIQKTFDNSGLEDALKRADRAEARAIKVLAGNFD